MDLSKLKGSRVLQELKSRTHLCSTEKFGRWVSAKNSTIAELEFRLLFGVTDSIPVSVTPLSEFSIIRISRLLEFTPKNWDPWGCSPEFTWDFLAKNIPRPHDLARGVVKARGAKEMFDEIRPHDSKKAFDRHWHVQRIAWLLSNPEDMAFPISVDNVTMGDILPVPDIIDGWHRVYAHRLLGRRSIIASYGGRVDVLQYLTGEVNSIPGE